MFRLCLALIACAGALLAAPDAAAQRNVDYCSLGGRNASLMLIDRTSPYSLRGEDRQGERIAAGVDAVLASLQAGDRFSIATIERHRRLSQPVFDACFPGCRNSGGFQFPGMCPEATIAAERRAFRIRLIRAVAPFLENTEEQPNSDVVGTIFQAAGQHRYTRLFIYSDMLENSALLPYATRFASGQPQGNMALVRRSGFVPVLRNAQVQVVGFGLSHARNHPPLTEQQDRDIPEFWRLYFAAGGAVIDYRTVITPGS